MQETILPCPHCGGNAGLVSKNGSKAVNFIVFVRCEICGAQGKLYYDRKDPVVKEWNDKTCEKAVRAWNMRWPREQ